MGRLIRRNVLLCVVTVAAAAVQAPQAWASITPTMSLDQSAGTTAGSTVNLGVDLKFAPTGSDSPHHMTMTLPPGLLSDASIDHGACLTTTALQAACQVGSGSVSANLLGLPAPPQNVTFDLVQPPAPGDLAGLAVNQNGGQVGPTADVKVRPSGDPNGVGITIDLVLPNQQSGLPISITEIKSTFNGLRYPTTCSSHSFAVAADSYSDPTVQTTSAPLSVTGCASVPFTPVFSLSAIRDRSDQNVTLTTHITQSAAESPSSSVVLAFPATALTPTLTSLNLLCADPASGTCTSVGSVTATSPLYPRSLTGTAYLTGSVSAMALTLIFPSPFPLTLTGSVRLGTTNTTTFTGLPDIPLTDLAVSLNGGPKALFEATCAPASATATATLTDQNGDKTARAPGQFTVSGCPSHGGTHPTPPARVTGASFAGLAGGHPSLRFALSSSSAAGKLTALTLGLPPGIAVVARRHGGKLMVPGLSVSGARVKSAALVHGQLVITLRSPVFAVTVRLGSGALVENASVKAKAKANKLAILPLTVIARTTKSTRTLHVRVTKLGR